MSDVTLNLYLQHQVNIAQYSRSEIEEALSNLQRLQDDVKARIASTTEFGSLSKTRLQGELAAITKLMQDGYEAIGDDYRQGQNDFVDEESEWQSAALSRIYEKDVAVISIREISSRNRLNEFEGKTFNRHLADISKRDSRNIRLAILDGVALGRTNSQIVDSVAPSLRIGRRDLQTLIRTGIQSNAAAIRDDYFEQNSDIVKQVEWIATLDGRVTVICRERDGKKYDAITKQPIGHTLPWIGGTPAHFNCRSITLPVDDLEGKTRPGFDFNQETTSKATSTLRVATDENGRTLRAAEKGERLGNLSKRMGAGRQYSSKVDFADWFRGQPAWFQDSYLGSKKAQLYRKGGLTLDKFSEKAARPLSLKELKKLYPKQWEDTFG